MTTIAALMCGRGNNTMKDKNVKMILGRPLLQYPCIAAKGSRRIDHFYISSNNDKILDAAGEIGFKKIRRPDEISHPQALIIDAIRHGIEWMRENDGVDPDILVLLHANGAIITTQWIDESIDLFQSDPKITSVVPFVEDLANHPFRAKKMNREGYMEPFFDFSGMTLSSNRQSLEPSYFLAETYMILDVKRAVYATDGQPPFPFMGPTIKPYFLDYTVDIHDERDIAEAADWIATQDCYQDTIVKKDRA